MFRRGEVVFLLVILLGAVGLVTFRAWSSPPSGRYVPPARDEHSYRVAEAYSSRCLQPSIYFSIATHRRPGPMNPQEADEHIRRLSHIARTLYSAPVPVDEEELRRVITARTEQLPALIESSNATLSAHAVVEATLRGAEGCVPAIARAAMRWQTGGKGTASRDLPYLTVHGIALLAGREARSTLEPLLKARSSEVQTVAAYELSFFGDKRAIPFLRRAFETSTQPPYRAPNFRATRIAMRLIALGDADTRARAEYLFRKLPLDHRYILPALAERRKPEVLQFIRELAVDQKQYHAVRKWAAIALGRARDREALPYLSRAAKDPVRDVAESALKAIHQIHGREVASSRR